MLFRTIVILIAFAISTTANITLELSNIHFLNTTKNTITFANISQIHILPIIGYFNYTSTDITLHTDIFLQSYYDPKQNNNDYYRDDDTTIFPFQIPIEQILDIHINYSYYYNKSSIIIKNITEDIIINFNYYPPINNTYLIYIDVLTEKEYWGPFNFWLFIDDKIDNQILRIFIDVSLGNILEIQSISIFSILLIVLIVVVASFCIAACLYSISCFGVTSAGHLIIISIRR
jgi:hypothetical protein